MRRRAQLIRTKLPHGVDFVAIVLGDIERERDVCAATGEFRGRWPVDKHFVQRSDAEDVGEIPLCKYGPEFLEE